MRHTDEFVFVQQLSEHHTRQLVAMYQKEWWTKGRELDEVEEMLRHSFVFAFLTKPDNDLAAFARVVTDRVFKALIFDVIVALPYRRCGLGQRLLQHIANDAAISKVRHLELYCLPDLVGFYERQGFSSEVSGVGLMRRVPSRLRTHPAHL